MVLNAQYTGTFQLIRQLVCHCDGFYGWTMDQVVERENNTKQILLEKINRPYSENEKNHLYVFIHSFFRLLWCSVSVLAD